MKLPSPVPLVDLSYRPDLHVLVVRWMGVTTDDETRLVYRHLGQVDAHQCRYWLLDARRRPSSGQAVTRWMLEEFAPLVSVRLGGPLYFSYLISPSHLAAAEEFRQEARAPHVAGLPYRLHYASQENNAIDWLLQAQAAEQAAR